MIRCAGVLAALGTFAPALSPAEAVDIAPDTEKTDIAQTPIRAAVFVAFDVETTGFSPTGDRIVEIAAVKFKGARTIDSKAWLVHPGMEIPARAQAVHGISNDMVEGKPAYAGIHAEFVEFIGDAVLLAHNASFDVNFVREEMKRAGFELPSNITLDTLALSRRWFPELASHRLEAVATHLGVGGEDYHRALDDARYLMEIFKHGLRKQRSRATVGDLIRQAGGALTF